MKQNQLAPTSASSIQKRAMDRTTLLGFTGTFASFGLGQVHAIVGIVAGLATIVYMGIKIWQLLK